MVEDHTIDDLLLSMKCLRQMNNVISFNYLRIMLSIIIGVIILVYVTLNNKLSERYNYMIHLIISQI